MRNSGAPPDGTPDREIRGTSLQLGGEVLRTLLHYVRGQFLISLILTAIYIPGFLLLHVPWWFFFAVFNGFLNLIPMFGTPIGMVATLLVAWAGGADLNRILILAGFFVLVMAVEGYFLTPRILGRRLGMSPLLVFFALLAGGLLFGFFGVLLAVPAVAVANVVWRHYRKPPRSSSLP